MGQRSDKTVSKLACHRFSQTNERTNLCFFAFLRSFVFGRTYNAQICLRFYLTFNCFAFTKLCLSIQHFQLWYREIRSDKAIRCAMQFGLKIFLKSHLFLLAPEILAIISLNFHNIVQSIIFFEGNQSCYATGYSFWDRLRIYLQKFTWIVLSAHKLNKLGKFW